MNATGAAHKHSRLFSNVGCSYSYHAASKIVVYAGVNEESAKRTV